MLRRFHHNGKNEIKSNQNGHHQESNTVELQHTVQRIMKLSDFIGVLRIEHILHAKNAI